MKPGMSSRASAMTVPGSSCRSRESATTASNMWPRPTSSIESAMTSRLMSEALHAPVPIVMPSVIATVLNSIGVPPAARIPFLYRAARARRW